MKKYRHLKNIRRQRGFAVMAVSLIMMFIITLNVFMGAKGSIIEQQTSTNNYAYEIALNNAEAGITAMFKQLVNGVASPPAITGLDSFSKQIYKVTFVSPYITSIGNGVSGSSTIQRAVVQRVKLGTSGLLTNAPSAINTLGNVAMGGNYSTTSINSGGVVTGKRENAGVITENSLTFQVNVTSDSGSVLLNSSGKPITRLMSPDELFMFFFGSTFCAQAYASNNAGQCIAEANTFVANSSKGVVCSANCGAAFLSQYQAGKRYFWVTNGLDINNSSGISQSTPLGSDADPVIIFIMDNSQLSFNGNSLINGVIYVNTPATTYSCTCRATNSVTAFLSTSATTALWGPVSYALYGSSNPSQCTASACSTASTVCQPPNNQSLLTKVGDTSSCNFQTPAVQVVTGSNGVSGDVVIQVLNGSSFTGTGNSQVRGALITSGNITSTNGNGSVVAPSGGSSTLAGSPLALDPRGWTDIVQ